MNVKRMATVGLLTSVALILGYVEHMLPPLSVPGVKLGLANAAVVYALYALGKKSALAVMLLKVGLSGFLFTGPSAMMYALAGGALSLAVMMGMMRAPGVSMVGVSAVGAVFHNVGQIALAALVLNTPMLFSYLPVLIISGAATGVATGIAARQVHRHLGAANP